MGWKIGEKSGEKRRKKSGMGECKSGITQGLGYTCKIYRGMWWFGR
jgi:hypothetical protein